MTFLKRKKNIKMKRLVTLLTTLGMFLSLTACDEKTSKDSKSTKLTTSDTQTEETTEPEEITELEEITEELVEPEYPKPVVDENAITFNDSNDLYTAYCTNEKNFENDESNCNLSIAEYKGQKQLKIEVLDKDESGNYKTPKITFDVDKLVGSENLSRVKGFSADITQVGVGEFICDDGIGRIVPGNLMGTFGSLVGEKCDEWYEPTGSANSYSTGEWSFEWVFLHVEGKWLLKSFVDGTEDAKLVFMRWGIPNQADIYLDNLTFYDADGKSIPIVYTPGSTPAE